MPTRHPLPTQGRRSLLLVLAAALAAACGGGGGDDPVVPPSTFTVHYHRALSDYAGWQKPWGGSAWYTTPLRSLAAG